MHGIRPASLVAIAAVVFLLKTGAEFFVPLFLSLLVAGLGHFLRLFAAYVSSHSTSN